MQLSDLHYWLPLCLIKAKFHYAVEWQRPGRAPTRTELVEIARICLRPAFDQKSRKLVADRHELVESQVGSQIWTRSATWRV